MNERIKLFAMSTGIYDCIIDPYDKHKTGDPFGSVMDDMERFAELIIEACMDQCFSDDYIRIAEHFGIELDEEQE